MDDAEAIVFPLSYLGVDWQHYFSKDECRALTTLSGFVCATSNALLSNSAMFDDGDGYMDTAELRALLGWGERRFTRVVGNLLLKGALQHEHLLDVWFLNPFVALPETSVPNLKHLMQPFLRAAVGKSVLQVDGYLTGLVVER